MSITINEVFGGRLEGIDLNVDVDVYSHSTDEEPSETHLLSLLPALDEHPLGELHDLDEDALGQFALSYVEDGCVDWYDAADSIAVLVIIDGDFDQELETYLAVRRDIEAAGLEEAYCLAALAVNDVSRRNWWLREAAQRENAYLDARKRLTQLGVFDPKYKTCPNCGTRLYTDMKVCYSCLYEF